MKNLFLAAAFCSLFTLNHSTFAQGTAFSYQGRLNTTNGPATGSYDLTFALFYTNATGSPVAGTITNAATPVSDGLFTVALNFGDTPYIGGAPLWLEISARSNGVGTFFTLTPRQEVLSAPYATYAYSVNAGNLIGSVTDANLASAFTSPHSFDNASDSFTGNGSGLTALNASNITTGTVADERLSTNVALRSGGNTFTGNQIVTNGSVGIGTKAPVAQFHVVTAQYGSQPVAIFDVDNCGGICSQQPYQENIRLVNLNPNGQTGLSFLTSTNGGDNLTNVPAAWIGTGYTSFNDNSLIFASQVGGALVDRMYLSGGTGFLGIGTDSPANMLDVQGGADFTGNVGIGTTSPSTALQVNGTVTATSFSGSGSALIALNASQLTSGTLPVAQLPAGVVLSNAAGLNIIESLLGNGSALTALNASNIITGTVADARLSTNVALRSGGNTFTGNQIVTNGNVGIGTTSPSALLEVNGTAEVDSFMGLGTHAVSSALLTIANNGSAQMELTKQQSSIGYQIGVDSDGLYFTEHNVANHMYLQNGTGNLGLGTTTPANTLEVNGSADFTGKVGIGTSAPVAQFHVVTAQYGSQPVAIFDVDNCGGVCAQQPYQENIRLVNLNPNGQTGLSFLTLTNGADNLSAVPAAWIGTGYTSFNDNSLIFASQVNGGLVDRMYLSGSEGFLGIGTDSPANMLDVQGSADFTGNVGIGTTTPTGHLSVVTLNGTVSITDDSFTPDLIMTGGPVPGDLRVRNRIEMWPNTNETVAGYFDVRTTNGTPVISLAGSNGVVTCVAMDITSDRNAKKDFKALNPRDVLAKVAALPITEWQYKIGDSKDAAAPRHIGPMAQDFSAAFELSHDDRHISVGDEGGVALAAIQGLNEELKETRAENAALKQSLAELKNMMEKIQRNLPASQVK